MRGVPLRMKAMLLRRFALFLFALGALLALGGCASGYTVDTRVQSFSQLAAVPPQPTYRFERLPSQQVFGADQGVLEAMADPALHKAGLRRDDSAPNYSVQVTARAQQMLSPYADPWMWGGFGWSAGFGHRGVGVGFGGPLFPRYDALWFQREANVVVRELASNQVVYETRAFSEGPWLDDRAIFPLLFDSAMQGFPNPPQGWRRIDVHVGG